MDFTLTPKQEQIRATATRVAREIVAPRSAASDREGRYPEDYFAAFREAGLLGLAFPHEYGGSGAGTLGLTLAVEEVAKYDSGAALILLVTRLTTACILNAGTAAQREHYVRGVATGQLRGCFALTEPEAGSDAANIGTTATCDGDSYRLNGTKIWAGQATVADYAIVAAKDDWGTGLFLVDLPNPGFRIVREMPKMGVLNIPVVEIDLHNCRVARAARIGPDRDNFNLILRQLNVVRPLVAARAVGLAAGATQYALAYAQQRRTFGKSLIEHEAIAFDLAELALEVEAARLLTYRAAWLVDQGHDDRRTAHFLSMAKAKASELAVRAAERCVQILGGFGYLKDYAAERYYRDAKQLMIVEGTSEIHRLIISRALNDGLLDWGYDATAIGGLPNDDQDRARRQARTAAARERQ